MTARVALTCVMLFSLVLPFRVLTAQIMFGPETLIDASTVSPGALATSDLNSDGFLDVVLVESAPGGIGNAKVYFGQQGSGFNAPITLSLSPLLAPIDVEIGDFVANGHDDIIVIDLFSGNTRLFANQGNMNFGAPMSGPSTGTTVDMTSADMNEDGNLDLIAISGFSAVRIYYGNGMGSFSLGPLLSATSTPFSVIATDLNNDAKLDVVIGLNSGGGGGFNVFLNSGTNSWPTNTFIPGLGGIATMIARDFDGDGNLDIIGTASGADDAFLMLGDGLGGFATAQTVNGGMNPMDASCADLDGDTVPELIVFPASSPQVRIYDTANGTLSGNTILSVTTPTRGVVGDFDEDGDQDIITANTTGQSIGTLTFLANETATTPSVNVFQRGDCNNDAAKNIADAVRLLNFLFPPMPPPTPLDCESACDANDDGGLNIADSVAILTVLFPSGPPVPWQAPDSCGADPTMDGLTCPAYIHCP